MENEDDNVEPKPIWKKPTSKKKSGDKCKKNIRFNLQVDVCSVDATPGSSYEKDGDYSCVEPSPKKRKGNLDMPKIPNEVEKEIERQLDSKKEKNKLTVKNVKNILRSVITNKYVVDMVRQTVEEGGVTEVPFEPKLTRAKTKELLQQHPDSPIPPVVGFLTPTKTSTSDICPEIKLLIDKELSEDSSDEEYNPENEPEQSEEDEKGETSIASDLDSLPPTPASIQAPPTPVHECSFELSQDGLFKVPQENVGQRTRSKLDLNQLPLESLEQAYVPPDITPDMYESVCDNPDWHDFLKEFTQPLQVNETIDDDVENDPEYNILEDEEKDPVEYKEEMRKDKAVKVTKKELSALMKELFEYTDTLSSDEDDARASESIAELEASIMKETEDRQKREEKEKEEQRRREQRGFHPNQRLLLAQQLRQHVQLMTQHFLQTYRHPVYHKHADTCKTMLKTLSGLKKDKICCQQTYNLTAALSTVAKWEDIQNHPETGDRMKKFVEDQIKQENALKNKKKKAIQLFPRELMHVMMESEAFLYPMLLPPVPFLTTFRTTGPNFFTPSEDMLLAICLEQVTQLMDENEDVYEKRSLVDMSQVICDTCIPRSLPRKIAAHIRKLKCSKTMNPVKAFFDNGKPPIVVHYVIPVQPEKKLCHQPPQLLPEIWRRFLLTEYHKNEEKPEDGQGEISIFDSDAKKSCKKIPKDKVKEGPRPREKLKNNKNKSDISVCQKEETSHNKQSVKLKNHFKTTKKETNKSLSQLGEVKDIQKSLKLNGLISLNKLQSKKTATKPENTNNIKQKSSIQSFSKKNGASLTESKAAASKQKNITSNVQCSKPGKSCCKSSTSRTKEVRKSSKKSRSRKVKKKKLEASSIQDNLADISAPKVRFNVVSKASPYCKNIGKKQEEGNVPDNNRVANSDCTDYHHEYFNGSNLLPNSSYKTCQTPLLVPATQLNICDNLKSQTSSESDSHQCNSGELNGSALFAVSSSCYKSPESTISHSPRPPSTVKLKGKLNLVTEHNLDISMNKVPILSKYSHVNGTT